MSLEMERSSGTWDLHGIQAVNFLDGMWGIKENFQIFVLSNLIDGNGIYWDWEDKGQNRV